MQRGGTFVKRGSSGQPVFQGYHHHLLDHLHHHHQAYSSEEEKHCHRQEFNHQSAPFYYFSAPQRTTQPQRQHCSQGGEGSRRADPGLQRCHLLHIYIYVYIGEIVEIVMNNTIGALGLQRYHLHVHHSHKRSVKIVKNDTAISSLVLSTTFLSLLLS